MPAPEAEAEQILDLPYGGAFVMRQVHPGLLSIIELHFGDVEVFLAEDFAPIASEDVRLPPSGLACRRSDRRERLGEFQAISLAVTARDGAARRVRLH